MKRKRYVPVRVSNKPEARFPNAELAWFWYIRCRDARRDGARYDGRLAFEVPPCEPDDISGAVLRLMRQRQLRREHVGALSRYGLMQRPPDRRLREEQRSSQMWDEALDKLTTILRQKEIVE